MRTTILIDDDLGHRFKETARKRGQSLSAFLAEAGKAALEPRTTPDEPFELIVEAGDGVFPGIDLNRTGDLMVAEDQQQFGHQP